MDRVVDGPATHFAVRVLSPPWGFATGGVVGGGWGVPTWVRALFVLGAQAKRGALSFPVPGNVWGRARVPEKKGSPFLPTKKRW